MAETETPSDRRPVRVLLVTTWDTACGIAEHAAYLKAAVEKTDPGIEIGIEPNLHPDAVLNPKIAPVWDTKPDVVWLNYHAALHSQWTPAWVKATQAQGIPVGITYHDTGVPNLEQCLDLYAVADRFVVHEPCEDLPGAIYLRQGVPDLRGWYGIDTTDVSKGGFRTFDNQPIVGSVGFPFPWKNYDLLAEASYEAGWALLLIAPTASPEQVAGWKARNPYSLIRTEFVPRDEAVGMLADCQATAFLYSCANAGTSAAIRLGLAARKPLLATHPDVCRQFRDLGLNDVAGGAIHWLHRLDVPTVARGLGYLHAGWDMGVIRAAWQDRWSVSGGVYARLFHELAGR